MDELEKRRSHAHANTCAICGKEFSKAERFYWQGISHKLMDGAPCRKCNRAIWLLLMHQKLWTKEADLLQAMGDINDYRNEYSVPVDKARALLALRDSRCEQIRQRLGGKAGVFAVAESFQVTPSPPIFFLRARKVRNRAVIRGISLQGEFRQGDRVVFERNGATVETTVVDAIPRGTSEYNRSGFYDELQANIHDHTLSECEEGWLILDVEADRLLKKSAFAVGGG